MTAPRLLRPFVRTRARLRWTLGVVMVATMTAASLPLLSDDRDEPAPAAPAAIGLKDKATALDEARRTGKEVLVDQATTATDLLYARPDGQWRSVTTVVPQRARTASGRWEPVDTTLSLDTNATNGLGVRPQNPPTPIRFSSGGDPAANAGGTVLAEADVQGHRITYIWPGRLPAPVLSDSRVLYQEVLEGVDLLLVARQEGGLGLLLIVKRPEAAQAVKQLSYGLRAEDAVFRHDPETGGLRVLDSATRAEIAAIPTPMAWDSSGMDPESPEQKRLDTATAAEVLTLSGLNGIEPGSRSAAMPSRVDGDGTGDIRLHLDAASTGLLTGADVTYPIFLDPALNTGEAAWLFVSKAHPNSNFMNGTGYNGGTGDARVGYEKQTGVTARSFWRMNFKNISGAVVSSSAFKVVNNHSWSCTPREFQLFYTPTAISTGTTWNKHPSWVSANLQDKTSFAKGYSDACDDEYVSFNAKDGAQKAATAGATTITLGLRASDESDTISWRKFQANTATLETIYNTTPAEPVNSATTPGGLCVPGPSGGRVMAKTNIILSGIGKDPDGNLSKLQFMFWKTGDPLPEPTRVTPDSTGKASVTILSSALADKTTYSWAIRSEDSSGALSTWAPPGTEPCRITIDASVPPAPDVTSSVFLEATPDGATWATVKFGQVGAATFESAGATKFTFSFSGQEPRTVPATNGKAVVTDIRPRNAGPNALEVTAYNAVGTPSPKTVYTTYVMPGAVADKPHDLTGDEMADLLVINNEGKLRTCPSQPKGGLHTCLVASYSAGGELDPAGHWFDPATGKTSLITKFSDTYPGDGITDLFVRHYDGSFWIYPGDGYGSFDVDQRIKVFLPANAPAPATWTQVKALGDITGDKLPDLALRAGSAFWIQSGYTGATFQTATPMGTAWASGEIINIADVDLDGTPDLTFRNPDTGGLYLRHGRPGTVAGSVTFDSLKSAAASLKGSDAPYGTGWTTSAVTAVVGIPDVTGDRIPDIWVRRGDTGIVKVHWPSATTVGSMQDAITTANWAAMKGFG